MSSTPNLNIIFLTQAISFPNGMASSTRLRLLARGVADQGCKTSVFIMKGTEKPGDKHTNKNARGYYHNVYYEYMSGKTVRLETFWMRRIDEIRGCLKTIIKIWRAKKAGQLDILFFYTRSYPIIFFFSFLCRSLKVHTVLELCEWPLAQAAVHGQNKRSAKIFCANAFKKVDAVIPISSFINKRIKDFQSKNKLLIPTLTIPILVEPELFISDHAVPVHQTPYVLYCGSLNYYDIVETLVDIGAELKKRNIHCSIKILGGRSSQNDVKNLEKLIVKNKVTELIEIESYLGHEDFRKIQQGAIALLAPFPDNLQTWSRFPTKIGEYLLSGKPVIISPYGEAKNYLTDKKTAFIAIDNSSTAIVNEIEKIIKAPLFADNIGKAGRNVALTEFSYSVHGPRLINFLKELSFNHERKN